jgi:hypothetical protein
MIDLNVARMVPYRKDEVVTSYQLLGVDEIGYAKVMLAIVHRDLVKRHVTLLESAGLSIERILLSSHGVWQWTVSRHRSELASGELFLLLDVDATMVDCLVCSRDHLLFSRSIAITPDQLAQEAGLTKLIGEVSQSLEIFQSEENNRRPVKAFLSGASASIEQLEQAVNQVLKLPTTKVDDPFTRFAKGKAAPGPERPPSVSLSAVAELATDESQEALAFILPEMQIKQSLKERTRELVLLGSLSTYVLTLLIGLGTNRPYHHQTYLKTIQTRNAAITQEIGPLVAQAKRLEAVKERLRARELPLRYLAELQHLVPEEITIDFLSVDEQQRGAIRGQAIRLSDVFKFITTLEHSRYVDGVEAKYTRRKKVRDKDVTEFKLTLRVRL